MERPSTQRQRAGCGLMKGPLGRVSTDTIMKMVNTPTSPVQMLLCQSTVSSLNNCCRGGSRDQGGGWREEGAVSRGSREEGGGRREHESGSKELT